MASGREGKTAKVELEKGMVKEGGSGRSERMRVAAIYGEVWEGCDFYCCKKSGTGTSKQGFLINILRAGGRVVRRHVGERKRNDGGGC